MPATLGNSARRRGGTRGRSARRSRPRCRRSWTKVSSTKSARNASAIAASGWIEQEVPVAFKEQVPRNSATVCRTIATIRTRSAVPSIRPPLRKLSSSAIAAIPHEVLEQVAQQAERRRLDIREHRLDQQTEAHRDHQRPGEAVGPAAPADQPAGHEHPAEQAEEGAVARDRLVGEDDRGEREQLGRSGARPQRDPERGAPRRAREAPQHGVAAGAARVRRESARQHPVATLLPRGDHTTGGDQLLPDHRLVDDLDLELLGLGRLRRRRRRRRSACRCSRRPRRRWSRRPSRTGAGTSGAGPSRRCAGRRSCR